jgi:hypothetical protein
MIIQLRGTSGSGKSHIVRGVLEGAQSRLRIKELKRKQPLGYIARLDCGQVAIPGHYETPCGGCDTIPDLTKVFDNVRLMAGHYRHVLFEGLLASEDTRRTLELAGPGAPFEHDLRVVQIITPIEDCLAGIQLRRDNRGDTRPINPTNTANRVRTIARACDKLKEAGVPVYSTDRDGAAALVKEWLR